MILLSQELGQFSVRSSWQSVSINFGCIWFMSNQPISSLRPIPRVGWGMGCNPEPPRPHDIGWHRGDGTREPAAGLQWKMKTAAGWGINSMPFSLLPFPFPIPCTSPKFYIKFQFPEPTEGKWMRSLVMLWVNNLVRKLKNELTEAISWCISIAQLWSLQYY